MRIVVVQATTEQIQNALAELKRIAPIVAEHAKLETLIDGLNAQIRVIEHNMTISEIKSYFAGDEAGARFQYWMAIEAREWIDGTSKTDDLVASWAQIEMGIAQRMKSTLKG